MANFYQKIKSFLASPNLFHVLYVYILANIIACLFNGAADPLLQVILSPVLAWIIGVFVECLDGYFGTKQLDETGIEGNSFSTKDLLYDAIGAVLAMITIGIIIL